MGENPILKVDGLTVTFTTGKGRGRRLFSAVDDVSFHIAEGEIFGIVGESGCGKTTTGRTVLGLCKSASGSIELDGREICMPMTKELRAYISHRVSAVFQDPYQSLDPRMSIGDSIGEALKAAGVHKKDELAEQVAAALVQVGLTPMHMSRFPHEFSGGQLQRVGIARAIAAKPKLIIADEPVSALDVSIQAQIINLLRELQSTMGMSILFIAHDLAVVRYFCHRIGVMYLGKLVEIAPAAELYAHPMHPYTRSLLGAIPIPNPLTERKRRRNGFRPSEIHAFSDDNAGLTEVSSGHWVYCSPKQAEQYRII